MAMNFKSILSKLELRYAKAGKRKAVVMAVVFLLLPSLLVFSIYLGNRPKFKEVAPEQASEQTADAKQETKTEEDVPTQEQAIDAAIRAHERSTKVCYDPAIEGFLIHYPHLKPAEDGTTYFDGWYYLKYQQMWKTDNGIWFMKDYAPSEYVRVYPDVTGLNCKNT